MKILQLKISSKLVIFSVAASLMALFAVGTYFHIFLEQDSYKKTQQNISLLFQNITKDLKNSQISLCEQTLFLDKDELLLSSIYLINTYENQDNYNAILLDEEKKIVVEKLLKKVKFSSDDKIILYGKEHKIIAGVKKDENGFYMLFFSTFIDKKQHYFVATEIDMEYRLDDDIAKYFNSTHKNIYSDGPNALPKIIYNISDVQLVTTAHHSIFSANFDFPMAHVEISKKLTPAVLLSYLVTKDNELFMSIDSKYAQPLSNKENLPGIRMSEDANFYIGSLSRPSEDGPIFIVSRQNKANILALLHETRSNFLVIFFMVAFLLVVLMYSVYYYTLVRPLKVLMNNIVNVKDRNFDNLTLLQTHDELEEISYSIDQLAHNVEDNEKKLKYIAEHDELTGLFDRYHFNRSLEKAITNLDKDKKSYMALIFIDVDQFKLINDTLGHNIGDLLLIEIATRLKSLSGDKGFVSRIGGDEFIIILENITDDQYCVMIAQKINALFESPFLISQHTIKITVSMGISLAHDKSKSPNTLFKYADIALYKSKERGRNRFTFYEEAFSLELLQKSKIIDALKSAIEDFSEFSLVYQPKVLLKTGKPNGVEALIRWNSKTLGFVSPSDFIPIAEETGIIIEIGNWVLKKAAQDIVQFCEEGFFIKQLSINISSIQLQRQDFIKTLRSIVQSTHIDPHMLELEITERYIATSTQEVLCTLNEIRNLGMGLAIDDFGTGYSSLSYLKKLPVTNLKIDKSFIDEISFNSESLAVVKAIIVLAKTFNLLTTAEGVETKEQLDFLRDENCDEIQGYYFAKPMKLEDLKIYWKQFS